MATTDGEGDRNHDIDIIDNQDGDRYEARIAGELAGWIEYRPADGWRIFIHTEVLPSFSGRGVGRRLASWALDDVRARGMHVAPKCPYIAAYIRAHPAYQDLVGGVRGTPIPRRGQDPRHPAVPPEAR